MSLLRNNHTRTSKTGEYATSEDFYRLFTEDMTSLYLFSLLLTGHHETAEQCFVSGFTDSVKGNRVFKEWAHSWAKRTILKNAIQIVAPLPHVGSDNFAVIQTETNGKGQSTQDQSAGMASVLALRDFDRFVLVMSVCERYSDKECSLLLGCSQQDVRDARMRALQQIAESSKRAAAAQRQAIQKTPALAAAVEREAARKQFTWSGDALCR